jgi:hypothetical protein
LIDGEFQSDSVFTGLCAGLDTVVVTDSKDCGGTNSFALHQGPVFKLENAMLYPNPSRGQFTFEMDNQGGQDLVLEIINMTGQLVFKKLYKYNGNSRFTETIDLSNRSKGVYLMRVNGLPVNNRLMIQ